MPEAVLWQYRWLNPSNKPHHPPEMLAWKPVEHPHWQPLELKLQELRDYRYDGKPCYEVRALGVIPPTEPSLPDADVQDESGLLTYFSADALAEYAQAWRDACGVAVPGEQVPERAGTDGKEQGNG